MRYTFLSVLAAFSAFGAAAPPSEFHRSARLILTTVSSHKLERLVNTAGNGKDGQVKVTPNVEPEALIKKVEIVSMDGKGPKYVVCAALSIDHETGEQIYVGNAPKAAVRGTEGTNLPLIIDPPDQVIGWECYNADNVFD